MNTYLLAKICYYLQLHRLGYFLNRKRKRIITFHNVLDDNVFTANLANGVSCSLSSFKHIIDEIGRVFTFSLNLDDPASATITFDDGYNNQAEIAAPYLISKGIPAYLFVSGHLIVDNDNSSKDSLIIDKLLHWVSYVPSNDYIINLGSGTVSFRLDEKNRNIVWTNVIWPLFVKDTASKGTTLFNALNKAYPYSRILDKLNPEYIRQRLTGITPRQIENLKCYGWEIGWHTLSHYPVSLLSITDKEIELTPNTLCDSQVFSFPYGGDKDADNISFTILKNRGYKTAVSNINHGNSHNMSWYRTRMSLSEDKALLHFELSGLKYLIKYKKLLPKL